MTRPKPKTVRAWAFAVQMIQMLGSRPCIWDIDTTRDGSRNRRRMMERRGFTVGPVVRVEVPAPKERKR